MMTTLSSSDPFPVPTWNVETTSTPHILMYVWYCYLNIHHLFTNNVVIIVYVHRAIQLQTSLLLLKVSQSIKLD